MPRATAAKQWHFCFTRLFNEVSPGAGPSAHAPYPFYCRAGLAVGAFVGLAAAEGAAAAGAAPVSLLVDR